MTTLFDFLTSQAENRGDDSAYLFLNDGVERWDVTYGELYRRVLGNAAVIAAHANPGDRAVLVCPPGPEFVVAYFACLTAGVVAVPTTLRDPARMSRGAERLSSVVDDCAPALVLNSSDQMSQVDRRLPGLHRVPVDLTAEPVEEWRPPRVRAEDLAMLQYTSGSTSAPKGVALTHANLLANAAAISTLMNVTSDSVGVSWLPTFHDMGLIAGVVLPLVNGARGVLMPPVDFVRRPVRWLQAISAYRGTISGAPNFAYEMCRRRVTADELAALDLSSWDAAYCGAEPVRADTMDGFAEDFAPAGFERSALMPVYGLAEATLIVSGGPRRSGPRALEVDRQQLAQGRVRTAEAGTPSTSLVDVGPAASTVDLRVVDPDTGAECADGAIGEVWVGGPSIAQGYFQRPEESAEVFANTLPDTDTRYLRTGDLGALVDGHLFVTGRRKDLIIVAGQNIYPQDLELAAEQASPAVRPGGCAAFAAEEDSESVVVVAEVDSRCRDEDQPDVARRIRQEIAETHELAPERVVLIRARGLPKTSSGKVQRRRCRELLDDGGLAVVFDWPTDAGQDSSHGPGFSAMEDRIADLCEEVLGVRPDAGDENLARLGGGSLSAIRLVNEVNKHFGVEVRAAEAFRSLTVGGLAEAVERARRGGPAEDDQRPEPNPHTDAVLDPDVVVPADRALASAAKPREVLLTGATGFVGAFLLDELLRRTKARVHCLVRARSREDARNRLVRTLRGYGLSTDGFDRVVPVAGDLAEPEFGLDAEQYGDLAARVDAIVHSAASVSAVQGYETLRGPNVLGTREVLRLATRERLKRVHHISTLAAMQGLGDWHLADVAEEPIPVAPSAESVLSGYPRSKWVAEQLVHAAGERGVPVSIYRLARVSGDSEKGYWAEGDFWWRVLTGSVRVGVLPDAEWVDLWTPVDHVAEAVVRLALRPSSAGRIFHVADTPSLRISDVHRWLEECGYALRIASRAEWVEALEADEDNPMWLFLPHLRGAASGADGPDVLPVGQEFAVRTANLRAGLDGSGVACPQIGSGLLATYLERMAQDGIIPKAGEMSDR